MSGRRENRRLSIPLRPLFVKNSVSTLFTPDGLALVDSNLDTALGAEIVHGSRGCRRASIRAAAAGVWRLVGFALVRHRFREVGQEADSGAFLVVGFVVSAGSFRISTKETLVSRVTLVALVSRFLLTFNNHHKLLAMDPERECSRLWRAWRTVHEMVRDRVGSLI